MWTQQSANPTPNTAADTLMSNAQDRNADTDDDEGIEQGACRNAGMAVDAADALRQLQPVLERLAWDPALCSDASDTSTADSLVLQTGKLPPQGIERFYHPSKNERERAYREQMRRPLFAALAGRRHLAMALKTFRLAVNVHESDNVGKDEDDMVKALFRRQADEDKPEVFALAEFFQAVIADPDRKDLRALEDELIPDVRMLAVSVIWPEIVPEIAVMLRDFTQIDQQGVASPLAKLSILRFAQRLGEAAAMNNCLKVAALKRTRNLLSHLDASKLHNLLYLPDERYVALLGVLRQVAGQIVADPDSIAIDTDDVASAAFLPFQLSQTSQLARRLAWPEVEAALLQTGFSASVVRAIHKDGAVLRMLNSRRVIGWVNARSDATLTALYFRFHKLWLAAVPDTLQIPTLVPPSFSWPRAGSTGYALFRLALRESDSLELQRVRAVQSALALIHEIRQLLGVRTTAELEVDRSIARSLLNQLPAARLADVSEHVYASVPDGMLAKRVMDHIPGFSSHLGAKYCNVEGHRLYTIISHDAAVFDGVLLQPLQAELSKRLQNSAVHRHAAGFLLGAWCQALKYAFDIPELATMATRLLAVRNHLMHAFLFERSSESNPQLTNQPQFLSDHDVLASNLAYLCVNIEFRLRHALHPGNAAAEDVTRARKKV